MQNTPLTRQDLINDLKSGIKPPHLFRIGTEHEQFIFDNQAPSINQRIPYAGARGIGEMLKTIQHKWGWLPIEEDSKLIGLRSPSTTATISLEPGGQFELSGAPLETLHQVYEELVNHQHFIATLEQQFGVRFVALGVDPYSTKLGQIPWMPKSRYQIMQRQMQVSGKLGLEMMTKTCTIQANLDFSSEQDMVTKFKISMALQPFISALFANSSLVEGNKTHYASYRCKIWQNTDQTRCGLLKFVFEEDMGFERYVDYMLGISMYGIKRNGKYIDVRGQKFEQFMNGKLITNNLGDNGIGGAEGEFATLSDWHDHLTIVFPEVRLKHYLEMRGADSGPLEMQIALPSLWVGLLYSDCNLRILTDLVASWNYGEIAELYSVIPERGLLAQFKGRPLRDWLAEIVELSSQGLKKRCIINSSGGDESVYLTPLLKKIGR